MSTAIDRYPAHRYDEELSSWEEPLLVWSPVSCDQQKQDLRHVVGRKAACHHHYHHQPRAAAGFPTFSTRESCLVLTAVCGGRAGLSISGSSQNTFSARLPGSVLSATTATSQLISWISEEIPEAIPIPVYSLQSRHHTCRPWQRGYERRPPCVL